ncbi:hypothetical protein [Flavobacterium sp. U410]|jgi:hypothetical protein
MFRITLFLLFLLNHFSFNAQNVNEIDQKIKDHFKLDRENIYLHFNKNTYFSNETIWFKGYILDKKTNKLNPLTTNVYITLYDSNKNEIQNYLFYASNGIISGKINLTKNFTSGKYFLHIYTNYMNNFTEDESTLEELEIINITDSPIESNSKVERLNFEVHFEGGKLLFESDNSVSVKITDCKNKGIKTSVNVIDTNNNTVVTTFQTNEEGYGKFDLLNTKNSQYSINTTIDGKLFAHNLPPTTIEGINLSALTFVKKDNVMISIKTNNNTFTKVKDEKFKLIIEKNDSLKFIHFNFDDSTKKDFFIEQKDFFSGLNTLRLIDSKNNSVSERLIFIKKDLSKLAIQTAHKHKDSIQIKGLLKNKVGVMSISILPDANISQNSIISLLEFENTTKKKLKNSTYYFKNFDRKKQYELDIYLMGCKSKHLWNTILNDTIIQKYDYEFGVNLSGKINQTLPNKNKLKLKLYSSSGINLTTHIENDNSFHFKNLLLEDSTYCHLSLLKDENNLKKLNVSTFLKNNNSKFLKPITIENSACSDFIYENKSNEYLDLFPKNSKIIKLDSINLVSEKKEKLLHRNTRFQNNHAKGFKISEDDALTYSDILSFIAFNGFIVDKSGVNIVILARVSKSISGSRSPIVYLDNIPLTDFSLLLGMSMRQVDEVYINTTGFGEGMNGANGSIRIYTKIGYEKSSDPTVKSDKVQVKKGFQKAVSFKNIEYQDYDNDAFKKYGVIDWKDNIFTDENGNFEFSFPHFGLDEFYLDIQGLDNFGNFYHEIIPLKI